MKQCTKCGGCFQLAAFSKDRSRADGLFPQCRECCKADKRRYYANHKQESAAYSARWAAENRLASRAIKGRWALTHREDVLAAAKRKRQTDGGVGSAARRAWYAKNREAVLKQKREYNAAHPEAKALRQRRYELANRDAINQKSRERYAADPSAHNAIAGKWARNHPGLRLSYVHARRARKLENGGTYTDAEWAALKEKYGNLCLCCLRAEPEIKLTVDHVIPLKKGGSNSIENIQPLCLSCNHKKHLNTTDYRNLPALSIS